MDGKNWQWNEAEVRNYLLLSHRCRGLWELYSFPVDSLVYGDLFLFLQVFTRVKLLDLRLTIRKPVLFCFVLLLGVRILLEKFHWERSEDVL